MENPKPVTLITQNKRFQDIISAIDKITQTDSSVLVVGETGVGKEMVADYIHYTSHRRDKPFVKVSLSALPPELLESELFGHEKGSFTSAHSEKKGLFQIANTGTIFLDDIDDVPIAIQSKLLRVLESKELFRIGATKSIPIDVRLITASKVDLKILIEKGLFRSDLFYRINVMPMEIPSLRERKDDVPVLFEYFLKRYCGEKKLKVTENAMQSLIKYSWPGNVRELRNVAQRVSLFSEKEVLLRDLPIEVRQLNGLESLIKACDRCFIESSMSFDQVVACLEINLLNQALKESDNNQSKAAKILKMRLSTFRDKIKKYNLLKTSSHKYAEIRK